MEGDPEFRWQNTAAYSIVVEDPPLTPCEPGSLTLLGIGIAGMAGYAWRRRKQQAAA
jgi:hypothetical protein